MNFAGMELTKLILKFARKGFNELTSMELAIENSLSLNGGKRSKTYSVGILADRNSDSTSQIVRFTR